MSLVSSLDFPHPPGLSYDVSCFFSSPVYWLSLTVCIPSCSLVLGTNHSGFHCFGRQSGTDRLSGPRSRFGDKLLKI